MQYARRDPTQQVRYRLVYHFSCKRTFICASCDAKRALLFGEHLHEKVLPAQPQVHQVYSVPKILRPRLKFNRRLLHRLFHAACLRPELRPRVAASAVRAAR